MKLHILTKIRITLIIGIAAGIFWMLLKSTIFNNNGYPQTIWGNPSSSVFRYIILNICCITATIAAFFLGGKNTRYIAPLATPFALLLPAVFSSDMSKLLVINQTSSDRSGLFTSMIIDTFLWYIPVIIGLMLVVALNKKFTPKKITQETDDSSKLKFGTDIPKCILSATIASVIAIIVLPYLCQGDSAGLLRAGTPISLSTVVSMGQQAFAVTATFFLAVMATHQLLGSTGKSFIPIPIVVAIFFYMKGNGAAMNSIMEYGTPPQLIPQGLATLTILPITYSVFGSLGIAWGYWNSYKLHYARENNLIQIK